LYFAPASNILMSTVSPADQGKASGANNALREVGGALGVAVLASVFSAQGGYESPQAFTDGTVPALWIGAAAVAVAAAFALLVPGKRNQTPPVPATAGHTPETGHATASKVPAAG
ncbi:MFS transporter, partial [Streptomyces sp. NPDC001193]